MPPIVVLPFGLWASSDQVGAGEYETKCVSGLKRVSVIQGEMSWKSLLFRRIGQIGSRPRKSATFRTLSPSHRGWTNRPGVDRHLGVELQRRARACRGRDRPAGEVCCLAGAPDQRLPWLPATGAGGFHRRAAPSALPTADSYTWFTETAALRAPSWRNEVTLRTIEYGFGYEPDAYLSLISPTPLMLIVAVKDHLTVSDLSIGAYEQAHEPKRLVLLPGISTRMSPVSNNRAAQPATGSEPI
jgi:hypothetical protein